MTKRRSRRACWNRIMRRARACGSNASSVREDEALLAFGEPLQGAAVTLNLSPAGNLVEAAANLFAYLRRLDSLSHPGIAVMPIPSEGLGEAINDRLMRAAAPRPSNPNSSS